MLQFTAKYDWLHNAHFSNIFKHSCKICKFSIYFNEITIVLKINEVEERLDFLLQLIAFSQQD